MTRSLIETCGYRVGSRLRNALLAARKSWRQAVSSPDQKGRPAATLVGATSSGRSPPPSEGLDRSNSHLNIPTAIAGRGKASRGLAELVSLGCIDPARWREALDGHVS